MVEIFLYIVVGILFGAAIPTLFVRKKADSHSEEARYKAMDQLYRELLKKRQSSDFRYSAEVRKVIDRVHAENMLK